MRHYVFLCGLVMGASAGFSTLGCGDASERSDNVVSALVDPGTNPGHFNKGHDVFFAPFPGTQGNGRACSDCHVESDAFVLKPATVEARYQAMLASGKDDPLFRSIDADDGANDYTTLRTRALVRVTIDLNPNIRLYDDPTATSVTLLRHVPSVLNVAYTAPYQLDGRQPDLQSQALGALHGHAQIQHDPNPDFLDDIAAYENAQLTAPDPSVEPALTDEEQAGKATFTRTCVVCHGGPVLGTIDPRLHLSEFQTILVSAPRPPGFGFAPNNLPIRRYQFRNPDGSWTAPRFSSDPGRALITGSPADFGAFKIRQLRGIAAMAPYFHDNSAATLEDVVAHYVAFFKLVCAVKPSSALCTPIAPAEVNPLLAYLRKI